MVAQHRLHRRAALALPALALPALLAPRPALAQPAEDLRSQWENFRGRFLAPDGRIVDSGNKGISHSEGQGYGLLLAVATDDRPSFEKMLAWTRRSLKRRGDNLFAWRFRPDAANPVADQNNAADGDLFIAWALLRAGQRWGSTEYTGLATAVARDVLRILVRQVGRQTVLLPGARGFERRDKVLVNLSYYVFPAIRALAQAVPDPAWVTLAADGLALLRAGRFGKWRLPPDWVQLVRADGKLSLPEEYPPRFGFDAVRVPLYLAWARLGSEPGLADCAAFWADAKHPYIPAWIDLTNDAIAPYAASAGTASVARLAAALRSGPLGEPRGLPSVASAPDYYSAVLGLLVRLAWRELLASAA